MSSIEYKELLNLAIKAEIEANKYYLAIAEKAKDASVKHFFKELAADELDHRNTLEAYLKTDAQPLTFAKKIDYTGLANVQKPEFSSEIKLVDAIAFAMKNEQEAMEMYKAMAASSQSPEQQQMFEAMAVMEQGHKANLEKLYMGFFNS